MTSRTAIVLAAFAAVLAAVVPAFAYPATGTVDPSYAACVDCHGTTTVSIAGTDTERQGPHGNYLTSTTKCPACHNTHGADTPTNISSPSLLVTATVTDMCETCHDGTGGQGVYGTLLARGVYPVSKHRVDATRTIPGGDPSTGGDLTGVVFEGGVNMTLGCIDCHSPHNKSTVASFTGDRRRIATDTAGYTSNRLLKQRPTSSDVTVTRYGSNWCAACHKGSLNTATTHNHPSETTATAPNYFYQDYPRANAPSSTAIVATSVAAGLGQNNYAYVMPTDGSGNRIGAQVGHYPLCQQCHEDVRNVGDVLQGQIGWAETYTVTSADGTNTADNPRFQVFPHESQNPLLLVETEDDLCTNCHDPMVILP